MDNKELENRVGYLEKKIAELENQYDQIMYFNFLAKERYLFELLRYLFDKLGIDKPDMGHKFGFGNPPSDNNGQGNQ